MDIPHNRETDLEEDPRFKVATRESLIIWGFALLGPALQVLVAELLGKGPGEKLTCWFGLPAWIWLVFFIIPLTYICVMIYIVRRTFKSMPFDPYLE